MDKFTVSYVLIVSLAFLGWSSFKIRKAFGKKTAIFWAVAIIVYFVIIAAIFYAFMKLMTINKI